MNNDLDNIELDYGDDSSATKLPDAPNPNRAACNAKPKLARPDMHRNVLQHPEAAGPSQVERARQRVLSTAANAQRDSERPLSRVEQALKRQHALHNDVTPPPLMVACFVQQKVRMMSGVA